MSNEKLKTEVYQGLGGINAKYSPYITGPLEFLDIQNFDFQMPGALTQRWGSTMYVGQTLAGKVTTLFEFSRLDGTSFVFAGSSGGLWYGATTGQMQGVSFNKAVASSGSFISTYYDVYYLAGTGLDTAPRAVPYLGGRKSIDPSVLRLSVPGQTLAQMRLSTEALNDYLFAADGDKFFKFNGSTFSYVGLPPPLPIVLISGFSANVGITIYGAAGATNVGMGVTGSYAYFGSWVNGRGFESQIWPLTTVNATQASSASLGGTFVQVPLFVAIPPQYDISSFNLYSYWSSASLSIGTTTAWNLPYGFLANYPASGSSLTTGQSILNGALLANMTGIILYLGSTLGGQTNLISNTGELPDALINTRYPIGFTIFSGTPTFLSAPGNYNQLNVNFGNPQYLSAYQNRLFLAGFSGAPSLFKFSDTGEPEGFPLENAIEVRTNDSDVLTGMLPYATRMYFFKRKSFHVLSGDNISNFFLQQVHGEIGAINNRCLITFSDDETLAFLDRKGIYFFNGSKPVYAAIRMQPYFDRMNYTVAVEEACMVHDKLRNQILCAIPIDGSSINNITIVYDYVANSWTTQKGVAPAVLARIQGRNNTENAFYGSYSGMINWYGPSFTSDSGVGFTCYIKSRFDHEMGETVQKQYRRFYMNMDAPSSTLMMPINFFQDYGASKVLSTTYTIGVFQNRLEYGISARALAFEIYHMATTSPLRIYGYSLSERMQRNV